MTNNLSLKQIVDELGGELSSNGELVISHVGSLAMAQAGAISFFNDTKYTEQLIQTKASAVVLKPEHAVLTGLPVILTDNPYAYFAKASQLLNPPQPAEQAVHISAVIDPTVTVPETASIGAHAVVADNVTLGDDIMIGAGCIVERGVSIGSGTVLEANVTVKHDSKIGKHCHIFSGAVIGNDGFGYAETRDNQDKMYWEKIPQVGRAILEDYVDIGSNTTVDRGAIDDTVIEEGVKIDNLVQIAHNCRIGAHSVIAGCVGIAGSAIIGKHCKIGGAAMVLGHLDVADGVTISPGSMITKSIEKSDTYTALMPFQAHADWLKTAANIRHLNQLSDKIKALEASVEKLSKSREL